jgi:hypothetical protein
MGPAGLLEKIVNTFDKLGIPYLITGSVAAIIYGEPRMTNDIDIVAALEKRPGSSPHSRSCRRRP